MHGLARLRSRPVLVLFVLGLAVALNAVDVPVRGTLYGAAAPVQSWFFGAGRGALFAFDGLFSGSEVAREAERLGLRVGELEAEVAALKQKARETEELRSALELQERGGYDVVAGRLAAKDPFADVVIVEFAREGEVEPDMAVVTPERVAVGLVEEVLGRFARVRLLSAKDSSVDVALGEASGVAKGEGGGEFRVELVPQEAVVAEQDPVFSSRLSGVFPESFLVGYVSSVSRSDVEPFQSIGADSAFNVSSSIILLAITNEEVPREIR